MTKEYKLKLENERVELINDVIATTTVMEELWPSTSDSNEVPPQSVHAAGSVGRTVSFATWIDMML